MAKIEVKKVPKGTPGPSLGVYVDGVQWGGFRRDSHGPRGCSYILEASNRSAVRQPADPHRRGSRIKLSDWTEVKVYSDNIYSDRRLRGEGSNPARSVKDPKPFVPLKQRLIDAVADAINNSYLRSPDVLKAEAQAAHERRRAAEEAIVKEKAARLDKRIDKVMAGFSVAKIVRAKDKHISPLTACGDHITAEFRQRIADAMDWAQSQ